MRSNFGARAERLDGPCLGAKAVKDGASGHDIHFRAWRIDRALCIALFESRGIALCEPLTHAEQERDQAHFASCLDSIQRQ